MLALGAVSAVYGILQAAIGTDLKRLLAYSTTENMGLVLIGVGAGWAVRRRRGPAAGRAGDGRGAAARGQPRRRSRRCCSSRPARCCTPPAAATWTTWAGCAPGCRAPPRLFGLGALAASALPPGAAFVSEWLLLQALDPRSGRAGGVATAIVMPLAVAAVALTAGLAVATFVKAFGVGFLARPAARQAAHATESPPSMLAGMGVAAAACVGLALLPALVLPAIGAGGATGVGPADPVPADWMTMRLTGFAGSLSPLLLTVALVVGLVGDGWSRCWRGCSRPAGRPGVGAAVGLRRRPAVRADGVHRNVVRRAAAAGVRRRGARRAGRRRHPLPRVALPGRDGRATGGGYPTGSSTGCTDPVLAAVRGVGPGRAAAGQRQRAPLPRLRLLRRCAALLILLVVTR